MIRSFSAMMVKSGPSFAPTASRIKLQQHQQLSSWNRSLFSTTTNGEKSAAVERFFQIQEETTKGKYLNKTVEALKKVNQHELDTGTPEAQTLTVRIERLQEHFATHKKDKHSRRGMDMLVIRRRKVMKHLKRTSPERYKRCVDSLMLDPKLIAGIKVL